MNEESRSFDPTRRVHKTRKRGNQRPDEAGSPLSPRGSRLEDVPKHRDEPRIWLKSKPNPLQDILQPLRPWVSLLAQLVDEESTKRPSLRLSTKVGRIRQVKGGNCPEWAGNSVNPSSPSTDTTVAGRHVNIKQPTHKRSLRRMRVEATSASETPPEQLVHRQSREDGRGEDTVVVLSPKMTMRKSGGVKVMTVKTSDDNRPTNPWPRRKFFQDEIEAEVRIVNLISPGVGGRGT